jgi:hypothetical protein
MKTINTSNPMNETLEHPAEIADEVVQAPAPSTSAVIEYGQTEAALAELRTRLAGRTYDLRTTAGDKLARSDRLELTRLLSALEARRVELKAPLLDRSRLLDAEAKRIAAELEALRQPIDAAIRADEQRRETERREREAAEACRIATLRERLKFLTDAPARAVGKTSAELDRIIGTLEAAPVNEATFAEFLPEALQARGDSLAVLREMRAATRRAEAEAERLKWERERLERDERLRRRLHELRSLSIGMMGRSPGELREALDALDTVDVSADTWGDFAAQALEARGEVHSDLQRMLAAAVEREAQRAEAHRLAAIAAEQAEVQRRQDEVARAAAEAAAAAAQAQQAAQQTAAVVQVQAEEMAPPAPAAEPAAVKESLTPAAPADQPATLTLGAICKRLDPDGGLKLTAAFLADRLHVTPAKVDGSARLFTEAQFQTICQQLQSHISAMAELYSGGEE